MQVEQARPQEASASKGTMAKFSLAGKVAVVTGGARGLQVTIPAFLKSTVFGLIWLVRLLVAVMVRPWQSITDFRVQLTELVLSEMARGLCDGGLAGIAILDILEDYGEAAVQELHNDFGLTASFYRIDVRDSSAVEECINGVVRDYGKIDILIASAGVGDNIAAEDYPADRFRRVFDINTHGVFFVSQAIGKHMIATGNGGSMIFIASMSASIVNYPQPQCAYNASKAAVAHLGRSLAAEWAPHNIRVNCISPGYMNTLLVEKFDPLLKKTWFERTPMGRMGHVSDLNGGALYLASDASSFVTGIDLAINGGYQVW